MITHLVFCSAAIDGIGITNNEKQHRVNIFIN